MAVCSFIDSLVEEYDRKPVSVLLVNADAAEDTKARAKGPRDAKRKSIMDNQSFIAASSSTRNE